MCQLNPKDIYFDVRIPVELTLRELATFCTCYVFDNQYQLKINIHSWSEGCSFTSKDAKRLIPTIGAAKKLAKEIILDRGMEAPNYVVGDNNLEPIFEVVQKHLLHLYKNTL